MDIIMAEFELYTLNISNTWDPFKNKNFWEATLEVPDHYSLFDLHLFIQNVIDFDNDHLFEFHAGRNERNRKIVYSEEPGYPNNGGEYENTLLQDIYPLKGLKLYYVFDLGDNWVFEVRKSRKKTTPQKDTEYPRVVSENGTKLEQYTIYDFEE